MVANKHTRVHVYEQESNINIENLQVKRIETDKLFQQRVYIVLIASNSVEWSLLVLTTEK